MNEKAADLLLAWYDRHARQLPWRGIHDPYKTWISETMLQQTRVETVRGYYRRFLERFPDIASLAAAPLDDVLKQWEGLGYYSRARNLHKGAQQIMEQFGGAMPSCKEELLRISGIGPYTAGAIASIAFDQPVPAVDGNVIRVISRLSGIRENVGIPSVKRQIEQTVSALIPAERPGDFNQAIMDLGAGICVPGTPECDACPLRAICDAYDAGDAEDLPVLPRKNPPRTLYYDVLLMRSGDRVLMRQRTESLLHGMWVYPMLEEWHEEVEILRLLKKETELDAADIRFCTQARHVFTHRIWEMRIYAVCLLDSLEAPPGSCFVSLDEMKNLAIPTAVKAARAAAETLLAGEKNAEYHKLI